MEPIEFKPQPNNLIFQLDEGKTEVLRISPDGFFVRGVQIQQGEGEAKAVYDAFIGWLQKATWNSAILEEISKERDRQDGKWGAEQDDRNNPLDWHETIADYNGWARRMLCMGSISKGRRRLIQLAAIAVAEVEALDRRFPDLAMDDQGDHPDRP